MPSKPEKANADRRRRYYEQHERELARSRAYHEAHKDERARSPYDPAAAKARYQAWKTQNPDGLWAQWLKARHGMRPEQWFRYWLEQGGKCYLCDELLPEDRSKVMIDHDHVCCGKKRSCRYCRRGLAHTHCNWLLGMLGDDLERMRPVCSERFISNFARAQEAVQARIAGKPAQMQLMSDVVD